MLLHPLQHSQKLLGALEQGITLQLLQHLQGQAYSKECLPGLTEQWWLQRACSSNLGHQLVISCPETLRSRILSEPSCRCHHNHQTAASR
jgi:hypothetical protein